MFEPSVIIIDEIVTNGQELYAALLSEVQWDARMQARKTASFGVPYNYSGYTYEAVPMHELLLPLVDLLEERLGFRPNNCLLNYYADGDSTMGFHSDHVSKLSAGTGVAIISLGAERSITFQSKQDKKEAFSYVLKNGSLLYMSQEVQREWKHAILRQKNVGGRISLTFRQIEE